MINRSLFDRIFQLATQDNRNKFFDPLIHAMELYNINTPARIAAFTAQVIHESGSLKYVVEIASGQAYEGRKDLGNLEKGDGVKYKGRGLIQLTGKRNYEKLSEAFKVDFVGNPKHLEDPEWASLSACWFWNLKNLNPYADKSDFKMITKLINGGFNGWENRFSNYNRIKKILGI